MNPKAKIVCTIVVGKVRVWIGTWDKDVLCDD